MKSTGLLMFIKATVLALVMGAGGVGSVVADGLAASPGSKVSLAMALADAHRLAAVRGDAVVRVSGASMLPYFGDGSVLVVRATPVESLRAGMVVVYHNRFGERVAHRIEGRAGEGWTVRGANNAVADSTPVTAENLVGTVYVTFYSDPRVDAETVRLAGVLGEATPVALAAPAR
jgi:signal peptidase I